MVLLFLEFLGTTELLVIALVALIIFGPRKLPELGRSLGKSLGEFKRASEDFKQTWEREVEVERIERELRIDTELRSNPMLSGSTTTAADASPVIEHESQHAFGGATEAQTIARNTIAAATTANAPTAASTELPAAASSETDARDVPAASRKQDWL
ncbi:MAG TPA: twin-arginine translocase TatA/TatE family subunit [Pyrinomonadaceae bacterium]